MTRNRLRDYGDAIDTPHRNCSCLQCVERGQVRFDDPFVYISAEDRAWNQQLKQPQPHWAWAVLLALLCVWCWFCVLWQTGECLLWAWRCF